MHKETKKYFCRVLLQDLTSRVWPNVEKLEHFLAFIGCEHTTFKAIAIFDQQSMELVKQYDRRNPLTILLKHCNYKKEWFSNCFDEPHLGIHLRKGKEQGSNAPNSR